MKILAVAEFDPALVLSGHRRVMRAAGHDYRLAIRDAYTTQPLTDWWLGDNPGKPQLGDLDELRRFAAEADIVQFHPAIGQPWSFSTLMPHLKYHGDFTFGDVDLFHVPGRRITYFHGSRNAAANAALYAKHYRSLGFDIWTSTVDYVDWMDAKYAPPVINMEHLPPAELRGDDDPLFVVQAPTDPENCHTAEIHEVCRRLGIVLNIVHKKPHADVIAAKQQAHAGFDHLRGCFSVNTLENMALGIVPLVGLSPARRRLAEQLLETQLPFPALETVDDLADVLYKLDEDPLATRLCQTAVRNWFTWEWSEERITSRLVRLYEEAL